MSNPVSKGLTCTSKFSCKHVWMIYCRYHPIFNLLSIYPSIYLSIYLSIHPSITHTHAHVCTHVILKMCTVHLYFHIFISYINLCEMTYMHFNATKRSTAIQHRHPFQHHHQRQRHCGVQKTMYITITK